MATSRRRVFHLEGGEVGSDEPSYFVVVHGGFVGYMAHVAPRASPRTAT